MVFAWARASWVPAKPTFRSSLTRTYATDDNHRRSWFARNLELLVLVAKRLLPVTKKRGNLAVYAAVAFLGHHAAAAGRGSCPPTFPRAAVGGQSCPVLGSGRICQTPSG